MGIPFECDLCHFWNMNKRDPVPGHPKDKYTLLCIRRANLDAMWSRETSTVSANLTRLRRDYTDAMEVLSLGDPLPILGTNDLEDRVGMACACITLNASNRVGRHQRTIQWDTMRKTPTWYSNAYEAGEGYGTEAIYSNNDKKVYASSAPTASRWFPRFMLGTKRRMGVCRKQNEAITVNQVMAVCEIAERDWSLSQSSAERKHIEEVVTFMVVGFCISLRGEEVPLIAIDGLIKFWEETKAHSTPHMMITLKGRFKGENNLRWHCVPLADKTKSNIPTRRWLSRLLNTRVNLDGQVTGFLFARQDGRKASLGDYDASFRDYLERARESHAGFFFSSALITDYSLRRSLRRGATIEAENNNVDTAAIELINRWRKKESARGAEPTLSMRQVYTQVSRAAGSALRFSQSF